MNLLVYNANTQYPNGGAPTPKQTNLANEMNLYQGAHGNVDVAGFTEVRVPNNTAATQANVSNALNNLGTQLGVPTDGGGNRQIAVIRCGRTALQDIKEVVAIVLDGNALNVNFGLLYFTVNGTSVGPWINLPVAATPNYTSYLEIPSDMPADYRFIVYTTYTLGASIYTVGFAHNRAPQQEEKLIFMDKMRQLMKDGAPNIALNMLGGDFNSAPQCTPAVLGEPCTHDGELFYWTTGNTTVANRYDWWISKDLVQQPGGGNAVSNATPNAPDPNVTGSDHRGIGIDFVV